MLYDYACVSNVMYVTFIWHWGLVTDHVCDALWLFILLSFVVRKCHRCMDGFWPSQGVTFKHCRGFDFVVSRIIRGPELFTRRTTKRIIHFGGGHNAQRWFAIITHCCIFGISDAVCTSCYGHAGGCKGSPTTCPWVMQVAQNVAAFGAAAGGMLVVERLLPPKYVKLFPRMVLQILSSIHCRPKAGSEYDFARKTNQQIRLAVVNGHADRDQALLHFMDAIDALDPKDVAYKDKVEQLKTALTVLKSVNPAARSGGITDGAFLYILARLSTVLCGASVQSFDLCVEISDGDGSTSDAAPAGTQKRFATALVRPTGVVQLAALLHNFVLVCTATGLANIVALSPFIDEVVFEPLRIGSLTWPVAFELLVLYLRFVENNPDQWNIANVYHGSGGIDAKRREATLAAASQYPAAVLRSAGGHAAAATGAATGGGHDAPAGGDTKWYKGEPKSDTPSSTMGCSAWNSGGKHKASAVKGDICQYKHVCNQWVTDRGKNGQCHGSHKRDACTYDPTKKCAAAVK